MTPGITRGQSDAPLSPEGQTQADAMGRFFKAAGCLTCAYSSDSKRARQTVAAIKAACPDTVVKDPVTDILSWSMGEYEGKPVVETQPKIANFVRFLPEIALPGTSESTGKRGESFDTFKWRVLPYIAKRLAEWSANKDLKIGVVTHHRSVKLLSAWVKGGMSPFFDVDKDFFCSPRETGHPGSVWCMKPVAGSRLWTMNEINVKQVNPVPLDKGVYIIRHAATRLNSL